MRAKEIALISVYTALLIGGQFIFSWVAGLEIVTVMLVSFCYFFGYRNSVLLVNAFSLLRCFLFGFFPTVIILYLVYYNLFALLFSFLGARFKRRLSVGKLAVTAVLAALCTVAFTLFDDIITPVFYGYTLGAAKAYFIASLYPMALQTACAAVSVALLFPVLFKLFQSAFKDYWGKQNALSNSITTS